MVKRIKWVDRKFQFTMPVGVYPCILERLRGTPVRMESFVAAMPPERLTVQINEAWSIQEHIGHLLDLDELHAKRLDEYLSGAETLSPADMTNRKTYEANHNDADVEPLLASFRAGRTRFVARLEDVDESGAARTAVHPRLQQPMRLIDMLYFTAEHDDHHIAAMHELNRFLESRRHH